MPIASKKRKPTKRQANVRPPKFVPSKIGAAEHWFMAHQASHAFALHDAATRALAVLVEMERSGALRLPFQGYNEAVADLRKALA